MAEFERELIRERVKAGMKNAKAEGIRIGRPDHEQNVDAAQIAQLRAQGLSWKKMAKQMALGVGTLYRVAPANKPTC
jgi:putative DNA-invertase from lambdoid prophage Rac